MFGQYCGTDGSNSIPQGGGTEIKSDHTILLEAQGHHKSVNLLPLLFQAWLFKRYTVVRLFSACDKESGHHARLINLRGEVPLCTCWPSALQ